MQSVWSVMSLQASREQTLSRKDTDVVYYNYSDHREGGSAEDESRQGGEEDLKEAHLKSNWISEKWLS